MSGGIGNTPASAYPYPLLLRHLLHTPSVCALDSEIVYADRRRYDYRTLIERISRLAGALSALRVGAGATVAVMDWDSPRYLECFFAVPMIGAVLHTVNVRLSPEQILYTINHAEDDVLLVHDDFAPLLEQIAPRIEKPLRVVRLTDDPAPGGGEPGGRDLGKTGETGSHGHAVDEYESWLANADPSYVFPDFDEHTRATTFYTTGTTGNPKGVFYTHRQLVIHTLAAMAGIGTGGGHARFHRDDVYMPMTPMFHVHAWGFPYVATMMGVKQVYPGRYAPELLLELIDSEGVTFSHCVPTILHMLLSHPRAEEVDLSRWKVVIGGSALPAGLASRARSLGIDIFGGYGLSETCPVLTIAQLDAAMLEGDEDQQIARRCKAGRPIPLVDLHVVDEHDEDLPHDGVSTGEVTVRAPWLTQAYLKEPDLSQALWRSGRLHTGDIGHIDNDGYLQVTDRIKDVIKSGGEWISSLQLEDLVSQCPGVAEVAAIGVPDERWGERPLLLVVPAAGGGTGPDPADIKAHIERHAETGVISRWAVPERIVLVEAIDKTSVGKIDKKGLREKYA